MTKTIKKLSLIAVFTIFLTGCFGSDDTSNFNGAEAGELLYNADFYSIVFPADWEVIESSDFTSNVPSETQVGFRNNIRSDIFTANVIVSTFLVEEGVSTSDFAKSSKSKAKNSLLSYEEIEEITMQIQFGEETVDGIKLAVSGKNSSLDPVIIFEQIYVVNAGKGFLVTAAYLPSEDETVVNYLDRMLNSFALK